MANLTMQQLDDYLQRQYLAANPPAIDYSGTITDSDNRGTYDAGRWNSRTTDQNGFSTDQVGGLTLPGQTGTWMYQPSASGAHFVQMTGGGPNGTQYRDLSPDANGNLVETAGDSHRSSSFWNDVLGQSGLTGFVKDVLPIAATVASPFLLGAGAEGLAGLGAEGAAGTGAAGFAGEAGGTYAGTALTAGEAAGATGAAAGATAGASGALGTGATGAGTATAAGAAPAAGGAVAGGIGGSGITLGQAAGAVAPIVGGLINANSARNALAAQTAAGQQADATQRYFYDTNRADNAPFLKNGTAASNALAGGLGTGPATAGGPASGSLMRNFTVDDFNNDPVNQLAFKYGADQGAQEINRRASAAGSTDSGAILKALDRFRTDYVGSKAGDSFNRFNTNRDSAFNKLAAQAGTGQVATAQVGAAGMNAGNQIAQNQTAVGNARGASAIAQGNALSGGLTGAYNNYQTGQFVNALSQRPYGY